MENEERALQTESRVLPSLDIEQAPEEVLRAASDAAKALQRVVAGKKNPVIFNKEQYLEFEDWQTLGKFYGVVVRIVKTTFIEFGAIQGWEATAEAVHVATGRIISSADAMCLNDEEKWRSRTKYEWHYVKKSGGTSVEDPGREEIIWEKGTDGKSRPRKVKVHVGEETVPMFQLRSMCQTRAGSKCLRNCFAWVAVLAGYKPTPAEEMDGVFRDKTPTPETSPEAEAVEAEFKDLEEGKKPETKTEAKTDTSEMTEPEKEKADLLLFFESEMAPTPYKNLLAALQGKVGVKESLLNQLIYLREKKKEWKK